jgi:hypothetical protein
MLKALRFEEPDRPPHFETWFQLTREAFGMDQWSRPDLGPVTGARSPRLQAKTPVVWTGWKML